MCVAGSPNDLSRAFPAAMSHLSFARRQSRMRLAQDVPRAWFSFASDLIVRDIWLLPQVLGKAAVSTLEVPRALWRVALCLPHASDQ